MPCQTCLPTLNIQLSLGVPSVLLNLAALILPLPIIWKLQLTAQKRALLIANFVLGYRVIVLSLGRLITIAKLEKELETDLICTCLVQYRCRSASFISTLTDKQGTSSTF